MATNVTSLPPGKGGTKTPSKAPAPAGPLGPKDNPEVLAAINDAIEKLDALDQEAAEINAKKRAVREGIKARNIEMAALVAARAQKKMRDDKRAQFDTDLLICRKAMDLPIQPALFGDEEEQEQEQAPH